MKKVLHIFRKLLPPTSSFIRNQVVYHINYEPYIMYAERISSSMEKELLSRTTCNQITKGYLGKFFYKFLRILTPLERSKALEYIRNLDPDIIHVHYGVDMLVFSSIIKKLKIPVVVSFYGYDCTLFPKRFRGHGKVLLQRVVFENNKINSVFAMSPDMEKDLLELGCPKNLIQIHYYGTECNIFNQKREYLEKEELNFTIISGLSPKKGHLTLLKAWQKAMKNTEKGIKLNIIGSGDMQNSIASYIKKNNLNNVFMRSHINYGSEDHLEILKNTDVFVHPSVTAPDGDKEGIPGAIIEAMANGLPVISTIHAGIPYIIQDGLTGLLVEEVNSEKLSEAIIKLAENTELRKILGNNAQQHALKYLDVSEKEKELEMLYDKIIEDYSNKVG